MPNTKVEPATIARTIILVLALVNQILDSTGHQIINIDDETVNTLVTLLFTVSATLWCWWKNNSFTEPAILADEHMKTLKKLYSEDD